eukprot:1158201-Pelagomonas_calceolata.AAC.10
MALCLPWAVPAVLISLALPYCNTSISILGPRVRFETKVCVSPAPCAVTYTLVSPILPSLIGVNKSQELSQNLYAHNPNKGQVQNHGLASCVQIALSCKL